MDAKLIMTSQYFEFFRYTWSELASLAGFAENHTQDEPQSALTKPRDFAELRVQKLRNGQK